MSVPESPIIIDAPNDEVVPDPSADTLQVRKPDASSTLLPLPVKGNEPVKAPGWTRRLGLGALTVLAIAAVFGVERFILNKNGGRSGPEGAPHPDHVAAPSSQPTPGPPASPPPVEIHIAYGTEKQKWLEPATAEFAKTPAGAETQSV